MRQLFLARLYYMTYIDVPRWATTAKEAKMSAEQDESYFRKSKVEELKDNLLLEDTETAVFLRNPKTNILVEQELE